MSDTVLILGLRGSVTGETSLILDHCPCSVFELPPNTSHVPIPSQFMLLQREEDNRGLRRWLSLRRMLTVNHRTGKSWPLTLSQDHLHIFKAERLI